MTDELLTEIRDFLKRTGLSPSYFGHLSGYGNEDIVRRLENGKSVTYRTAAKLRQFMAENHDFQKYGRKNRQAAE